MARQIIKYRRRKVGGNTGYHTCPNCKGTGRVRNKSQGGGKH